MNSRSLVAGALLGVLILAPVAIAAQARPAVTTAARAAQAQVPVLPTGPLSATTKAAAAVRASRAAQASAANAATGVTGAAGAKTTSVVGYIWTANNAAIPDATVQLRNTVTGQIDMFTKSNSVGEFVFNNVDTGSYVIEYASDSVGRIAALGTPFTVAPGETVATFVRLSSAVTAVVPDLAGNVAASALQTATSAGMTAVVTPIAPVVDAPPAPASSVR
jgi:nicotinamide mononucleotide (NMN) deamidase PncC